jgi:hypothetical protein
MITEEKFRALEAKVENLDHKVSTIQDDLLATRKEYVDINEHILKELKKLNRKFDRIPCGSNSSKSFSDKD